MMDPSDAKTWPPGLNCTFDFTEAIATIQSKLGPGFCPERWLGALRKAFKVSPISSHDGTVAAGRYSLLFMQLVFVDELWKLLCEPNQRLREIYS